MKRIKIILAVTIAIILIPVFSLNSDKLAESVKSSLTLCFNSAIPSLLPFLILSNFVTVLILSTTVPAELFAFISSLLVGFPSGVKNVCELYKNGRISRKSATALLHCTANASPAYVISFIGKGILKNADAGIILFISQLIAATACYVFFKKKSSSTRCCEKVISITDTLCSAVTNGVMSALYICGYIVFFGIIADLISVFELSYFSEFKSFLTGFIEISRGMSEIGAQTQPSLISAAIILAFSGISVIMQCVGCVVKAGLSAKPLIIGKFAYILIMPTAAHLLSQFKPGFEKLIACIFILCAVVLIYIIFDKYKRSVYNRKKA